jgi:hypothetical protein
VDHKAVATIGQREKAERWDHLVELLKSPGLQDTYLLHLSKLRRATLILLASREELPDALVAELRAYQSRLDVLYLEAKDGFTDMEGILNAIPAYVIGSLAGELGQPDTDEDPRSPADRTASTVLRVHSPGHLAPPIGLCREFCDVLRRVSSGRRLCHLRPVLKCDDLGYLRRVDMICQRGLDSRGVGISAPCAVPIRSSSTRP